MVTDRFNPDHTIKFLKTTFLLLVFRVQLIRRSANYKKYESSVKLLIVQRINSKPSNLTVDQKFEIKIEKFNTTLIK